MRYPPAFLDEIRARVPLADVIGRKVKLTRRGREFVGLSPFQNEKTPSFTVVPDKGFYHCFSSGEHGDVISFVMRTEGLTFPEAVERLAAEAGLELPRGGPEDAQREERRKGLLDAVEAAAAWFEERLAAGEGAEARGYLERRGLRRETVARFRLGYAPNRRALRQALNARGFNDELLVEAGLLKRPDDGGPLRDYFFDRVMFPITDRRGRVIAFGGRALGESPAKYLNSPDSALFHKGKVLYNLAGARQAAHSSGEVIVAEGYMDVIALTQHGFPAAVAPLGTAVTEDQLGELWRLAAEPVVCLDGDVAGQRAAFRTVERALPLLTAGRSLRFALLPEGRDPDDLLRGEGAGALRAVLERALPLAEVLWRREIQGRRLDTPERRAGVRQALRRAVETIADRDLREAYRAEMERRCEAAFGYRRPEPRPWQSRAGRFGQGRPGRWQPWRGRSEGRWAGPGGEAAAPPVVAGPPPPPEQLARRRAQLMLATLINHPQLLVEQAEALAGLRFADRRLNACLTALIDAAAGAGALDSESLKCHLSGQGFEGQLRDILSARVYEHGRFAQPTADITAAATALEELIAQEAARRAVTAYHILFY